VIKARRNMAGFFCAAKDRVPPAVVRIKIKQKKFELPAKVRIQYRKGLEKKA